MKKYYFYFLLVAGALASCTKERPVYVDREFDPSVIETTFIASDFTCTNVLAKSSVTEKGVMTWSEGDEVYYFSDAAAKKMDKIAFTSSGKTPTVMLSHKNGSKYIAAYYPGENVSDPAIKDYTLNSFSCPGISPVQSGKIVSPAIAYAKINDDTRFLNLTLKNLTSALQFSLPENNEIDKVEMVVNNMSAGNEINGAFKVDITDADLTPIFAGSYSGKDGSQYVTSIATGKKGGVFYINVLPCTLAEGFTLKLYKGSKVQTVTYGDQASFAPGLIHTIGDPTVVPAEPETFTFTTPDLGRANNWEFVDGAMYYYAAEYGDLRMTVLENPGGSQNGYLLKNSSGWRFYQARAKGTLTIECISGRNIKTVKFTYSNKNGGVMICNEVPISSDTPHTFTDISSSRTFTCGSTSGSASGQYTITGWEITVQ